MKKINEECKECTCLRLVLTSASKLCNFSKVQKFIHKNENNLNSARHSFLVTAQVVLKHIPLTENNVNKFAGSQ